MDAVQLAPLAQTTVEASADARLQQSRRLDWRFLLPSPVLGDLGYFGVEGQPLHAALVAFSRSVTPLYSDTATGIADLDGVVIKAQASPSQVSALARRVRPGGFLYIELRRRPLDVALNRQSAGRYRMAITRLGFGDIELHWHWPSFDAGTRLVPLSRPEPLAFDLGKGKRDTRGRLLGAAARLAISGSLLARTAPCLSLIALRELP